MTLKGRGVQDSGPNLDLSRGFLERIGKCPLQSGELSHSV